MQRPEDRALELLARIHTDLTELCHINLELAGRKASEVDASARASLQDGAERLVQ